MGTEGNGLASCGGAHLASLGGTLRLRSGQAREAPVPTQFVLARSHTGLCSFHGPFIPAAAGVLGT
jgi:hypothetical protein